MTKSKKTQQGKKKSYKRVTKKELLKQLNGILAEANALQNPLESIPPAFLSVPLSSPSPNNNDDGNNESSSSPIQSNNVATIRHYASPLPPNILKQCLELFNTNMGDMYRQSQWGLDMDDKLKELQDGDARFLVVLSSSSSESESNENNNVGSDNTKEEKESQNETPINHEQCTVLGFAHFRYYPDDEDHPKHPITYLYELQIHPTHQKLGLGKQLMNMIELLSFKLKMNKVMLTVFLSNKAAMIFYKRKRYDVDECSPSNFEGGREL